MHALQYFHQFFLLLTAYFIFLSFVKLDHFLQCCWGVPLFSWRMVSAPTPKFSPSSIYQFFLIFIYYCEFGFFPHMSLFLVEYWHGFRSSIQILLETQYSFHLYPVIQHTTTLLSVFQSYPLPCDVCRDASISTTCTMLPQLEAKFHNCKGRIRYTVNIQ